MPVPARLLVLVVGMLSLTVGNASAAGWLAPKDISAANEVVDGRPEVAVDPAGNAVAIWERHVGGEEIVEATERPAGGDWSEPETISLPGEEGEQSQVTIDASGNAIAVWITGDLATDFVVRSAVRPPGGEWSEPEDVSDSIEGVFPRLVVDAAGEAVAVWTAFGDSSFIVQGAVRSADGEWSEPDDLSDEGVTPLEAPDVAIDASGNAIAVWKLDGSSNFIVQAAVRPAGEEDWEEPDDLSDAGQDAGEPAVAMNDAGEAVAVWTRLDGDDIVQAAVRPAGEDDWGEPDDLSDAGQDAGEPAVAMNDAGEAVAIWRRSNGSKDIAQAAALPADGDWEEPEDLSNSSQSAMSPVVAMSDVAGGAVAMWYRSDGTDLRVQAVVRSTDGNWSSPDTLSAAGENAGFPKVSIDASGNAFAVFGRNGDDGPFVQATGYDFVGPQVRNLQIPATGTVGEPVFFAVSPFDVFPLGATIWMFGDGSQAASGNAVSHVYSAPGAYSVTVSAFDASGNASTQAGAIAAGPVKPPPPACAVPKLVGKKLAQAKAALTAANCKLGTVRKPKRQGKRRRVLVVKSSNPAAGARSADGMVDLRLGPKPRKARR
jgi:PKD domain-containing protein